MPADEMTKTRQPIALEDLSEGTTYRTLWHSGRSLTWTAMEPILVRRVKIMSDGLDNTNQLFICVMVARAKRDGTTTDEVDIVPAAELGLDPNVETGTRTYELLTV